MSLLAVAALLALCTAGPILLGRLLGPGIGAGASLLGCVVWIYLGPKPMPGFLAGLIAVNGLLLVGAAGFAQFARWLIH